MLEACPRPLGGRDGLLGAPRRICLAKPCRIWRSRHERPVLSRGPAAEPPIPARVEPIRLPASIATLFRTVARNPLASIPEQAYREPFVRVPLLGRETFHLCDPDLVRAVLLDGSDRFVKSEAAQRALVPAVGRAVLTAEGERWRWQRRALAPMFRPERILDFVPVMVARAEATRRRWLALATDPTAITDAAEDMMLTTFDIVLDALFSGPDGIDVPAFAADITAAMEGRAGSSPIPCSAYPNGRPIRASGGSMPRARLRARVEALVRARRADPAPRADLLTRLIEAEDPETGQRMGDRDVADNLLTFMVAGHETTALALTWALYLLTLHPEATETIRAEVDAVTGGGAVEAGHVDRLVYTRAVIDEAMRLYPPAPIIPRQATEDVELPGLGLVRKGAPVIIPVYAIQRHRRLWSDPDRFDPTRFLGEAPKSRPRYAYLPFGAGPRICIGMSFALVEAVVVLATLLRGLEVSPVPGFVPELKARITLRPEPGLPMRVLPR
ncbi:cytochrome P450 [Methyloraptor flagellatus]|uniref:Cytochrome P450 n=1 Tax=Methyloraptor flagellatus TaxID=3162530 RepID=A0AAU7XF78_9HYPH